MARPTGTPRTTPEKATRNGQPTTLSLPALDEAEVGLLQAMLENAQFASVQHKMVAASLQAKVEQTVQAHLQER